MRNRLGQSLAGVLAVLVLGSAAACADEATAGDPSPAPSVSGPPVGATDARAADVYVQVLRRYLSTPNENSFPGRTFRQIFVLDRTSPISNGVAYAEPAKGAPIEAGTQQRIAGALTGLGPVSFVADRASVVLTQDNCEVVKDEGILVTLAPIVGDGDRVEVGVYGFVACLGATSLTYVVTHTSGGGWQVTGTTGPISIS